MIQSYRAEFGSGEDYGRLPEGFRDGLGGGGWDRYRLGAGPGVHAGPQLGQPGAVFPEQGHDVDEAAVAGLGLEAAAGIWLQGEAGPACERVLGILAVVVVPCFLGVHDRVIAAQVVGVLPRAFAGHDEQQVAVQVAEPQTGRRRPTS